MDKASLCIISQLFKLDYLQKSTIRKNSNQSGLHFGQSPILKYIVEHDGCTQQEIADSLGVTAASIALSTKRLQKSGFIIKKTDEYNLRRNSLTATEKGAETLRVFDERLEEYYEKLMQNITDEEKQQFSTILNKLILNACDGKEIDFKEIMQNMREEKI